MINRLQNILGITKAELIAVLLIISGLGIGAILKYGNYTGVSNDEGVFSQRIAQVLDSLAQIRKTSYIGTDNRNNSIVELKEGDTLVEQESLFPKYEKKKLSGKININTASKVQLTNLPGVGEKTAIKIVDYRKENPFTNPEEIMDIKGIGPKKYEKMKEFIEVK